MSGKVSLVASTTTAESLTQPQFDTNFQPCGTTELLSGVADLHIRVRMAIPMLWHTGEVYGVNSHATVARALGTSWDQRFQAWFTSMTNLSGS
jgi:hypothetical protein